MTCEKRFWEQLKKHNFRLTPQREMVLSVMHQVEGHATAEEIHQRVRAISSAVDKATVYRTLDLLQEFGLVNWVDPSDGQRLFKLIGDDDPHLHLVCRRCGVVIGAELEPSLPLKEYMMREHGFEVEVEYLSLTGLCQECLPAEDSP